MIHAHSSTPSQRARWVSELITREGSYGVVSQMSRTYHVSRQTLYSWQAKGQSALEGALAPKKMQGEVSRSLERAVLTLLMEGHASYRGIQRCLESLLGVRVSLGTIAAIVQQAGERAQHWLVQHMPSSERALALDELYSSQRGEAYLSVVDVHSGAVWASTSPVAVDGESWTLLLWELQEQGLRWKTLVSDGGKAIGEAVQTVAPTQLMQRDVWHVLHACQHVQGRVDRLVKRLEEQAKTVARQAERLAQGKKPRGAHPVTDVATHTVHVQHAQYVAKSLRYLSSELQRLLEVVVLTYPAEDGLLSSRNRREDLDALLALLAELAEQAPEGVQRDLKALWRHVQLALPHLIVFVDGLEQLQRHAAEQLGAAAVSLIGWAWRHRAILGPRPEQLVADLPPEWRLIALELLRIWDEAVRASSAVENWHSILRPYLAVHRTLSSGMLALVAVWHNHRVAPRGLHQGHSPLQRSGFSDLSGDWLVSLGYPPTTLSGPGCSGTPEHEEALIA
jgi:transposase-like protein